MKKRALIAGLTAGFILIAAGAQAQQKAGEPFGPPAPASLPEERNDAAMNDAPQDAIARLYDHPDIVRTLVTLEQQDKIDDVLRSIREISDGQDMKSAVLWLRGRVMADDIPDPRYALLYAESLLRIIGEDREKNLPLMETAAMVYLYGRLALAVDAQRCVDTGRAREKLSAEITRFHPLLAFYRGLGGEKRKDILGVAIRLEERASDRKPSGWLCAKDPRQTEAENGNLSYHAAIENELGNLMKDLDIDPRFVARRLWLERRDEVRRNFAREFY